MTGEDRNRSAGGGTKMGLTVKLSGYNAYRCYRIGGIVSTIEQDTIIDFQAKCGQISASFSRINRWMVFLFFTRKVQVVS
jgi:hypothetical protein